jgi:hypothetical protein
LTYTSAGSHKITSAAITLKRPRAAKKRRRVSTGTAR